MKRQTKRTAKAKDKKLMLTVDKVRELQPGELEDVAGGYSCCLTRTSGTGDN